MQQLIDLGVDDDHGIRKVDGHYECIISDHAKAQLIKKNIELETIDIFALRDIEEGEEITINYHGEPGADAPLWFHSQP